MFIAGIILFLLVGIALFVIGVRGERIDDHPLCRKCGFDLTGKPADSDRCGECGALLTDAKAIRIGHRRHRQRLVVAGTAMFLLSSIISGFVLYDGMVGLSWSHYLPTRWLALNATSTNATFRTPALVELVARLKAGEIGDSQLNALITKGLVYQGDLTKPWDTGWGDFLEYTYGSGKLTAAQWQQYVSQAWVGSCSARVRPRIRIGDPIPWWIDSKPARVSSHNRLLIKLKDEKILWQGAAAGVGAGAPESGSGSTFYLSPTGGGASGSSCSADEIPQVLKPGPMTLRIGATVVVGPNVGTGYQPTPVARGTLDLPVTTTFLPVGQPTVAIVHDPTLADAVRKSVKVDSITVSPAGNNFSASCSFTIDNPPVGLSFDIFLKSPSGEMKVGSFACPAGNPKEGWGTGGMLISAPGKVVDVILRGNPEPAKGTTNTFQAWDGEVVFKNVSVH
jgi:hypothetical protein